MIQQHYSFVIKGTMFLTEIILWQKDVFAARHISNLIFFFPKPCSIQLEPVFTERNLPPTTYNVVKELQYSGEIRLALAFTPKVFIFILHHLDKIKSINSSCITWPKSKIRIGQVQVGKKIRTRPYQVQILRHKAQLYRY